MNSKLKRCDFKNYSRLPVTEPLRRTRFFQRFFLWQPPPYDGTSIQSAASKHMRCACSKRRFNVRFIESTARTRLIYKQPSLQIQHYSEIIWHQYLSNTSNGNITC
eukprot:233206-Amphidinium_carterae.1